MRVIALVFFSLVLMAVDHRLHYLQSVRGYLSTLASPLYYLINLPASAVRTVNENLQSRTELKQNNEALHKENTVLRGKLTRYEDLEQENARLRRYLGSLPRDKQKVMIADVLEVELDPFSRKLLIDKGSHHGVNPGLPLLDTQGVLGQVLHVNAISSSVMLITDPNHVLPVQVVRNGLRSFAVGMGANNRLSLLYLPNTAEIRVGDELVTSGLGGKFPPGYPVGKVISVQPMPDEPYTRVEVTPHALLDRNREILLVWTKQAQNAESGETEVN